MEGRDGDRGMLQIPVRGLKDRTETSLEDSPYTLSEHAQERIKQRGIQEEWIKRTLSSPEKVEEDPEDSTKVHVFRAIPEFNGRVLHVVYNRDRSPWHIISAFFDRKYKGKL